MDTILGAVGTGAGVLNSMNLEVIQNKISILGKLLHQLDKPTKENVEISVELSVSIVDVLKMVTTTLGKTESDLAEDILTIQDSASIALLCSQAQM